MLADFEISKKGAALAAHQLTAYGI